MTSVLIEAAPYPRSNGSPLVDYLVSREQDDFERWPRVQKLG
jgi:hypothetical protein